MKHLRRVLAILTVCAILLPGVVLASDVTHATYHGVIAIVNANGTAVTNGFVAYNMNTASMISSGYMTATGSNTATQAPPATDVAYQFSANGDNNSWVFVPSIPAGSTANYHLYTGGTDNMNGKLSYFPGTTGMTAADSPTLELGGNFTIEQRGFVTMANTGANFTAKDGAITVRTTGTSNITAAIVGGPSVTANGVTTGEHTITVAGTTTPWLAGYDYRKSVDITGSTVGLQTNYQIPVWVFPTFASVAYAITPNAEPESATYGVLGNKLFWGSTYQNTNVGHIYKTDLTTGVTTTIKTGNFLAAWQGIVQGGYVWAVGEEKDPTNHFRAVLYRMDDASISTVFMPGTDDTNELVGLMSDGTYLFVGERCGGGLNDSTWPNGGGVWRIPIATYSNTATWTRTYEDTNSYAWRNIVNYGGKYYAYLDIGTGTTGRWRVISSTDLITWATELNYTAQNDTFGTVGTMIDMDTGLAVVGYTASDAKWHLFTYNGAWTDTDLGIGIAVGSQVQGYWDSDASKLVLTFSIGGTYTVKNDGTSLELVLSDAYYIVGGWGGSYNPRAYEFVTWGLSTYLPNIYVTSYRSTIRRMGLRDAPGVMVMDGNIQDDFDDLRFTNNDGTTLQDYWIEIKDDADYAKVWVEFDSISASPTVSRFYLYYGNPGAAAVSSGVDTFIMFSDGSSVVGWTDVTNSGAGATWTSAGGYIKGTFDGAASGATLYYDIQTGQNNYRFQANVKADTGLTAANYQSGLQVGSIMSSNQTGRGTWIDLTGYDLFALFKSNASSYQSSAVDTTFDASQWHTYQYLTLATSRSLVVDGGTAVSFTSDTWNPQYIGLYTAGGSGNYTYFDDIFVANYVSPEPTWTGSGSVEPVSTYAALTISIDGLVSSTTVWTSGNVTNNGNTWYFAEQNAMPYMYSHKIWIGGNLVQDINYEIDTTFTDLSGGGHDTTPSFRTSGTAGLSASLSTYAPAAPPTAPPSAVAPPWIGTANISGNFTSTGMNPFGFLADIITDASTAGSTPTQLPFVIISTVIILAVSLLVTWGFRYMNANGSLFAKGVLTLGIIGMFVATRWWDWWMLVMFVIFFATFGIMSRHQSFQN
jgi:hypothetical protein